MIHDFEASIGDDIFEGAFGPSGKKGGECIGAVFSVKVTVKGSSLTME